MKVFLDVRELGAGRFDQALLKRIEKTPDFVLILSPNSLDRCKNSEDWLAKEIGHAIQTKRNIIPIISKDFKFPEAEKLPEKISSIPQYQCAIYDHLYSDESINRLYSMLDSGKKRRIKWILLILIILISLISLGYFGIKNWLLKNQNTAADPGKTVSAIKERSFSYSLMVQKYRNEKPFQEPFMIAREIIFESDYRVRLVVTTPQPGYFYILNEGPSERNGLKDFNILFPSTTANNGSALLSAGQQIQIPENSWFVFDKEAGIEKLWMIWAENSVSELEEVKTLANPEDMGVIRKPKQIRAIQNILNRYSSKSPIIEKDETKKQTRVSLRDKILVYKLDLEHH